MTIKEIDHEIANTYKNIKNKEVSRIRGAEIIDELFAKKREALALLSVPNPEKKHKFKK